MPRIKSGESMKKYLLRCIPVVMKEGGSHTSRTQAAGKCAGMYRSHKKKAKLRKARKGK